MKVISIREPFATLIMNGVKKIETRSWKTNYRGELFIHASGINIAKKFVYNDVIAGLIKDMDMHYGNIICRCNLVDCVYMDDNFIECVMKNKIEYNLGKYEVGRYAWILEDIEPICPILVKGRLNIWNYEGEYQLLSKTIK